MRYLTICLVMFFLSGCEKLSAPDFQSDSWAAFRVDFCTESSALEFWETRDSDKLALLQGSLYIEQSETLDRLVKSHNHRIFIVLKDADKATTWQLTLKRDQASVTYFNTAAPEQSYQASTDPMFYRALNTLLASHMNETLDIFRKCEISTDS